MKSRKWILIVGEPGLDLRPMGRANHDTGDKLPRSAKVRKEEIIQQGDDAIIVNAGNKDEFIGAFNNNGVIDGGVVYFGHGDETAFFPGELPMPDENVLPEDLKEIDANKLGPDATIMLFSCYSAKGGEDSIANKLSEALGGRTVFGYETFVGFSGNKNSSPWDDDPKTGPISRLSQLSGSRSV